MCQLQGRGLPQGDLQEEVEIQIRQTVLFYKVDPDYGTRVAQGLNLDLAEIKKLAEN